MTEADIAIVSGLGRCWDAFMASVEPGEDIERFRMRVHELQQMVMARTARRQHPDVFAGDGGIRNG